MTKTALGRLRLIGLIEGSSFLILLGIAMPLKYLAGWPHAVMAVGWAHGVLFILYLLAICQVWVVRNWPLSRVALAMLASVVPFGPFLMERSLKQEEISSRTGTVTS